MYKKKGPLLILILAFIAGFIAVLMKPEGVNPAGNSSEDVVAEQGNQVTPREETHQANVGSINNHDSLNCEECAINKSKQSTAQSGERSSVLETNSQHDSVFKTINRKEIAFSESDFDFLRGAELGQSVEFSLGDRSFTGEVAMVREGQRGRAYAVKLPEGNLTVTVNTLGEFRGLIMFEGDSRVVEIANRFKPTAKYEPNLSPKTIELVQESGETLVAREIAVSDVICAPEGTVFPINGPQPVSLSGFPVGQVKELPAPDGPVSTIAITEGTSDHVLYLDFDGETVTNDFWNFYTGVDPIVAAPAPRANDDEWVNSVFLRVVEDYAPFNITVTTDRAVYDNADIGKRLHAIITPSSNDVAPGTGGVAFLNSYSTNLTPVVWVFNLTEYTCATTISHEAGHAFGLSHDGQIGGFVEYYGGHNGSYTPGWGPIMGAPFSDGFYDEVDQWSIGEYEDANNTENDISIIAGNANNFGYKQDDYADVIDGASGLDTGLLTTSGINEVTASGLISRQGDVDLFRFAAIFSGEITLTVNSVDVESTDFAPGSSTAGANLAADTRLLDSTGTVIATGEDFGDNLLSSQIVATVDPGIYYLEVDGGGRGADPSGGFSDYASLGRYTIVGELPTPPLDIYGSEPGGKLDQQVIYGDTTTSVSNGTDFGFSYPANNPITHTFLLENTGTSQLTNVTASIASGVDFRIVSPPTSTIPAGGATYMTIAYDPVSAGANGLDNDTVTVNYDTIETITFDFAVSGLSTLGPESDNYEVNNAYNQAYDLNPVEDVWLSDYKGPAFFLSYHTDFYRINVDNGQLITVEVAYDPTDGPITFELRNGYKTLLGTTTNTDGKIRFLVPANYNNQHKTLYIKASITGDSTARNVYDLKWSSVGRTGDDDFYEENDNQDEAFDLTGAFNPRLSEFLGKAILNDEDWYKIEIPSDPFVRMLYVRADFVHAEGNIDIEVIPESTSPFFPFFFLDGQNFVDEDYEVLTYSDPADIRDFVTNYAPEANTFINAVYPGTYYIRVTGDFAGNEYDLVVDARSDDSYEVIDADGTENDFFQAATDLGTSIIGKLLSEVDGVGTCSRYAENATADNFVNGVDTDWFRFTTSESAAIEQIIIDCFDYTTSMVFRLYNEDREFLGDNYDITEDDGFIFIDSSQIAVERPGTGIFYLEVLPLTDFDGLSNYDFRVRILSEPPVDENIPDDSYEENDTFLELYDLTANAGFWLTSLDGYGVQLDADWYQITVPKGAERLTVQSNFIDPTGDLELTLSRKEGPVLFRADDGNNSETIVWDNPEPGQYAVTITGARRGDKYNLFWDYVLGDDAYEENDTRSQAADLTGNENQTLSKFKGLGIQKDEDWYRITAYADTAELQIKSTFIDAEGDIDLEVYNSDGYLFGRSTSTDDSESITLTNPVPGDYFVRVYYGNQGNEYDLWWGAFTQEELDAVTEDAYEEDDSLGAGIELPSHTLLSSIDGLATQTDDDWFTIQINENNSGFELQCLFTHADGDIDVEVTDSTGAVISRSASLTDNEFINYSAGLPAGTYYIRVFGSNLGNEYDLYWIEYRDDAYEENDTLGTAFDLTELQQSRLSDSATGLATQGDDDWYKLPVAEPNSFLVVELSYTGDQGLVGFRIYDSNQNPLPGAEDVSADKLKYLQYALTNAGDYYIKVIGSNDYNEYDLFWHATPDDEYEDNDVQADAANISDSASEELNVVDINGVVLDDDWFVINPAPGTVAIELDVSFTHAFGNTDVVVYNDTGEVVAEGISETDDENLTFSTDPFTASAYYIEVVGADGNYGNSYTLNWYAVVKDLYEENDTIDTAFDLTEFEGIPLSEIGSYDVSADEDWFKILPTDTNLTVFCEFIHADGDIEVELFDQNGLFLERAVSDTDNELIETTVAPNDTYYIRVFGETNGNPYDLIWYSYGDDDRFEENDDVFGSADYRPEEYQTNNLVQLDEDWYQVEVEAGEMFFSAEITPARSPEVDKMVLELYSGLTLIDSAVTLDGVTVIERTGLAPGNYFLKVTGRNVGGGYTLVWSSETDDNYEINDTLADAYDLGDAETGTLSAIDGPGIRAGDDDYFTLTVPPGYAHLEVNCNFLHDDGDIALELNDASFAGRVGVNTDTDNETIVIPVNPVGGGTVSILVDGAELSNVSYDLVWTFSVEDLYEENDAEVDAADITSILGDPLVDSLVDIDGYGTQTDLDYYLITVPEKSRRMNVDVSFSHILGDINLEILDASLTSIAVANSTTNNENLTIDVDPAGADYYVVISGDNSANYYDIRWDLEFDDLYEVNNFVEDHYDLTDYEGVWLRDIEGLGTQADDDWYQIVVSTGATILTVDCLFTHADGDIDLELYQLVPTADDQKTNPDIDQREPSLVAREASDTDNEQIIYDVTGNPGIYFIRVYFGNAGYTYDLRWDDALVADDSDFLDDNWFFLELENSLLDPSLADPLANDDNDAFPNWAEFALDLDTNIADTVVIDNSKQEIDGETFFTISFIRSTEAVAAGYKFFVDESQDLNFDGAQQARKHATEHLDNGLERVTYRCTNDMATSPQCFFRIRVEAPEKSF